MKKYAPLIVPLALFLMGAPRTALAEYNFYCEFGSLKLKTHNPIQKFSEGHIFARNAALPEQEEHTLLKLGEADGITAIVSSYRLPVPTRDSLGVFGKHKLLLKLFSTKIYQDYVVNLDANPIFTPSLRIRDNGLIYQIRCRPLSWRN